MGTLERDGIQYQPGCSWVGGAAPPRTKLHPALLVRQPPWRFLLSGLRVSLVDDVIDADERG